MVVHVRRPAPRARGGGRPGDAQLSGVDARARLVAGRPHQRGPLRSVRAHTASMPLEDDDVGGLVAQHLGPRPWRRFQDAMRDPDQA